jgi:hypothetical protein
MQKILKIAKKFARPALLAFFLFSFAGYAMTALAAGGGGGGGGADTEEAFQNVVNLLVTWITRIGLLVGFVGAIMFGLAIKNNDADQKQSGLLTMVAGFVVAAICGAIDIFGVFD